VYFAAATSGTQVTRSIVPAASNTSQRKFVLTYQLQTKAIPIEFLGLNRVASGDESHKFLRSQHRLLSLGVGRFIWGANSAESFAMRLVSHPIAPVAAALLRRNISFMRHGTLRDYDPGVGVSIATLAYEYPAGYEIPEHAHGSNQLIYATRGVMEISAGKNLWLTPPHLAVWIPAGTRHRIRMPHAVSMRTLYLKPGLQRRL